MTRATPETARVARRSRANLSELPIEVPRDRHGSFEPKLVTKHQPRWAGFDDKIISLYARHDGTRDSGTPGRDGRYRGVTQSDFVGH